MNEAAVVQVIEPLSLPEKTYPTSELLSQTLGTEFSVVGPAGYTNGIPVKAKKAARRKNWWKRAATERGGWCTELFSTPNFGRMPRR